MSSGLSQLGDNKFSTVYKVCVSKWREAEFERCECLPDRKGLMKHAAELQHGKYRIEEVGGLPPR